LVQGTERGRDAAGVLNPADHAAAGEIALERADPTARTAPRTSRRVREPIDGIQASASRDWQFTSALPTIAIGMLVAPLPVFLLLAPLEPAEFAILAVPFGEIGSVRALLAVVPSVIVPPNREDLLRNVQGPDTQRKHPPLPAPNQH
jgi:hypothetical protein